MFSNVADGVAVYRSALADYATWFRKTVAERNGEIRVDAWGASDRDQAQRRSAELVGMQKALGITEEEDKVYLKEVGLPLQPSS